MPPLTTWGPPRPLARSTAAPSGAIQPLQAARAHSRRPRPRLRSPSAADGNVPGLSDAAAGAAAEPAPAAQTAGDEAPAAPAADAAAPHPQHSSGGSGAQVTWRSLLLGAVGKLGTNLWPLLLVHLVCDVLVWVLHRLSHRLTNEVAVRMLGSSGITPQAIGNLWWLSVDPSIANFKTGYQTLTIAIFLLAFPLTVLLKTTASINTVLLCDGDLGASVRQPWWAALRALRESMPVLKGLRQRVWAVWGRVFWVELMVAAAVVPLQFASLAVVTLPLTLPFLLDLQAAGAAAVLEGVGGLRAIKRSAALMRRIRWRLAVPFVGITLALRLLDAAKGYLLAHMPPRYYKELIEIPVGIILLGALGSLLFSRLQDVLPYVAYKEALGLEGQEGPADSAPAQAKQQQQQPEQQPPQQPPAAQPQ